MSPEGVRSELTLADYLAVMRRRALWLVTPIVVLTALSAFVAIGRAPMYRATSAVLIADSAAQAALDPAITNPQMLTRRIENEINFARSDATEARVSEALGFLPSDQVAIRGLDSADVLEFSAVAADPTDAARFANTWAEAYVSSKQAGAAASITSAVERLESRLQELQTQRTQVRAPLDVLRDQLSATTDPTQRQLVQNEIDRMVDDLAPSTKLLDAQIEQVITSVGELQLSGEVAGSGTARVLQVASPPDQETGAPLVRMIVLGLIGGAVVGVGLALVREALDRTIKSAEDITEATGLVVLGSIPPPDRSMRDAELALAGRDHADSGVADGYHRLSTAFQFAVMNKQVRSVLVTSASQSEGKTTTSSNLAWALAALGHRVALVDVDFRRPRLHSALGVSIEPGLANHLLDGVALSAMASYPDERLALITAGCPPPNPAEFVATREFAAMLGAIGNAVDYVVLDAPPILPVADSQTLARRVDAVVLTALAGKTEKAQLRRAVESIRRVGGTVLGVVLIGVKDDSGYGYGSYSYRTETARSRRWGRRAKSQPVPLPRSVPSSRPAASVTAAGRAQESVRDVDGSPQVRHPVPEPDRVVGGVPRSGGGARRQGPTTARPAPPPRPTRAGDQHAP